MFISSTRDSIAIENDDLQFRKVGQKIPTLAKTARMGHPPDEAWVAPLFKSDLYDEERTLCEKPWDMDLAGHVICHAFNPRSDDFGNEWVVVVG